MRKTVISFMLCLCLMAVTGCAGEDYSKTVAPSWVIEPTFSDAYPFSSQAAAVKVDNEEWRFIDKAGNDLWEQSYKDVTYSFSYAHGFLNGVAVVENSSGDMCYLYRNGAPFSAEYIYAQSRNLREPLSVASSKSEEYGYINNQRMWYITPAFQNISELSEGYSCAENNDSLKRYLVDRYGEMKEIQYDKNVMGFSENLLLVGNRIDGFHYEDVNGRTVIEGPFEDAMPFCEGLAAITKDGLVGYINLKGQYVIEPKYTAGGNFSEGLALVEQNGENSYIDPSGKKIIASGKFESSGMFADGAVGIRYSVLSGFGIMGRDGEWLVRPNIDYNSVIYAGNESYFIYSGSAVGIYSVEHNILIPPKYEEIAILSDTIAQVVKRDKYGLINLETGETVLKPTFNWFSECGEGLISAQKAINGKFGYINLNGEWIIEPQFDYAGIFKEGVAPVEQNGKVGYIANPLIYSEWSEAASARAQILGIIDDTGCGDWEKLEAALTAMQGVLAQHSVFPINTVDFSLFTKTDFTRSNVAHLLTAFIESYGVETACYLSHFSDVSNGDESYHSISFAASQGLFDLSSDTCFYPNSTLGADEGGAIVQRTFEYLLDVRDISRINATY